MRTASWTLLLAALISASAPACSCQGFLAPSGGPSGFGGFGGAPCPSNPDAGTPLTGGPATWSHAFTGDGEARVSGLVVTPAGEIVVAGSFDGTMDAGGGPLVGSGFDDIFVVKLDADGNHVWSKRLGVSGTLVPGPIAVDASGNIVLTAAFTGSIEYDGGLLDGDSTSRLALASLDPDGNVTWIQSHGAGAKPDSVAVDSAGNILLTAETGAQGTLAKYDPAGNHLWSIHLAGPIGFLAADGAGNSVVAEGSGKGPVVVRKVDPGGVDVWTQTFTPPDSRHGVFVAGVAVAPSGDIAFTGSLYGVVDFGGGPLASIHSGDAVIVELDALGGHVASGLLPNAGQPLVSDGRGGAEAASVAFAPGGGVFLSTLSSSDDNGGSVLLPAGVGMIELALGATVVRDHTSAAWQVDTDDFGYGPPAAPLAVDADGGAVIAWAPWFDECAAPLDFGNGPLSSAQVVVVRFPP